MSSWWSIELAAFTLSRVEWLDRPCAPLDRDPAIEWIRRTAIDWLPATGSLRLDVPWDELSLLPTDDELVASLLKGAAADSLVRTERGVRYGPGSVGLASRRRIPLSSLAGFADLAPLQTAVPDLQQAIQAGCADGHIHQGGSIAFESLVHWLAMSMDSLPFESELAAQPKWHTVGQEPLRPEPIIWLIRLALTASSELSSAAGLASRAAEGDSGCWSELQRLDPGIISSSAPTIDSIVATKLHLKQYDPSRWLILCRAEAILHSCVTQSRPGLDLFVSLFHSLTLLRRSVSDHTAKAVFFEAALEQHKRATPSLTALELRLGEPALTNQRAVGMRQLRSDLDSALSGYRAFLNANGAVVRATFPLGLVKTSAAQSRYWRYDCTSLYRVVEAAIDLFEERPGLERFVDGLDVCGRETDAPIWVFTPAIERFGRWCSALGIRPSFRCHAGEWSFSPLNGLRSIGELLKIVVPPGTTVRIGHGLALDSINWDQFRTQPVQEWIDDLVWAWGECGVSGLRDLRVRIEERLHDVVPQLLPADLAEGALQAGLCESLWEAYRGRADLGRLRRLGVITEDVSGRLAFRDGVPSAGDELLQRLIEYSLGIGALDDDIPIASHPLLGGDVDMHRQLTLDAYLILRHHVAEALKGRKAIIEVCPTSNLLVGGVRGYEMLPIRFLRDHGVGLTINSDDPALFHAFLEQELQHVWDHLGDDGAEILQRSDDLVAARVDAAGVVAEIDELLRAR